MDTDEIEVFLTLAAELHFGRTAGRLRLPQPRVSRLVARMERRAGGRLFDRTSRKVQLTALGERLRGRLEPAYVQLQAAFDDARREASAAAGVVVIGFTSTMQGEALTGLVSAFEAANPGCRVMLREVDLFDPWADLRRGEVDVVVNWLAVDEPDLTAGPAIGDRGRPPVAPPRRHCPGPDRGPAAPAARADLAHRTRQRPHPRARRRRDRRAVRREDRSSPGTRPQDHHCLIVQQPDHTLEAA